MKYVLFVTINQNTFQIHLIKFTFRTISKLFLTAVLRLIFCLLRNSAVQIKLNQIKQTDFQMYVMFYSLHY